MSARFYVESNGAGGWQCRDRKDGDRLVAYSAFRVFMERAASRLNGTGDNSQDWFAFYGVRASSAILSVTGEV